MAKKAKAPAARIGPLSKVRFDALAGYARSPNIVLIIEELEWYSTADERILGILTLDRIDHDWGWVIFGRDERFQFRAVDVNVSYPTIEKSRKALMTKLAEHHAMPDQEFYQGDAESPPMDFFTPVVEERKLHPIFKNLVEGPKYSSARGIIEPMMRFYEDEDGNFVEQFQTVAFDARLWELYLFAAFIELGYARVPGVQIPDFLLASPFGAFGLEASTINPPNGEPVKLPNDRAGMANYLENYVPLKLARVLRRKLEKKKPYWKSPEMEGLPFVLAVQDFHTPGSMRFFTQAATEYVFGVRHSIKDGKRVIERIDSHLWGKAKEKSGFFSLPESENVSAVVLNPQGTLSKFTRLGRIAGFGDRSVRIIRRGLARGELNPDNPMPVPFLHEVHKASYSESWVEGMVVLHNPRARIPLHPQMIPGAAHEFLQEDGRIMSLLPAFHPHLSETIILVPDKSERGTPKPRAKPGRAKASAKRKTGNR
ncbi:MAG: hypothetical protein KIT48_08075 [Pseudolabrys sp.]|nr:hypothetical protein [Pseudolabrys sp.]